jgi:tetratricopeptide (TPR) repeat protein
MLLAVLALTAGLVSPQVSSKTPDVEQRYAGAVRALYSLDFEIAEKELENLRRADSENPRWWNGLASCVWLKILYSQQKLNLDSYATDDFGTSGSKDSLDAATEARLRYYLAQAKTKAETRLMQNPKDVNAMYNLGVSDGILASFEATAKRSYLSANSLARHARDLHTQVLRLDPSYSDARLLIGMYDYVTGTIPGWIKIFLGIFGIRGGNKKAGIESLEFVAANGKLAATDAKILLVVVYNREKQYERSLELLKQLHTMYPRNYFFEIEQSTVLGKLGKWHDSVSNYTRILRKVGERTDGYDRLGSSPVLYALGSANMELHDFDTAMENFREVTRDKEASDTIKANSHLWLGKMYDTSGKRQSAIQEYDAVLALDCDRRIKEEAGRYKRKPFG